MIGTRLAERALDRTIDLAFGASMGWSRRRLWPGFRAAARCPEQTQEAVLAQILAANATTSFGRRHGFAPTMTAAEYRRAVPVQDYESLRPLIEEQERTGAPTLTAEAPSLYAQTSGTLGQPKYLPITRSGIERVARTQRLFATSVHARTTMFAGKIVGIGSPAVEGTLPGGSPFGSASGLVYEGMPSVVRRKYVLAPEVLAIDDHDTRYVVMATLCAAEREVTGVATANPSTLLRLRSVMVDRWDDIVTAVAEGRLDAVVDPATLDGATVEAVSGRLRGDRERASELRLLTRTGAGRHRGELTYADIWPRLAAITTWTGGSCGFALAALRPFLAADTRVVELGYSASELRGTVGIDPITNLAAPLLQDNWFEFVPRSRRDDWPDPPGPDDFLGLHQLEPGGQYYLYATTFDGLYRYDMNDIVEVTGTFEATPTLAFVQKGRGVTNITGEKLTESQVLAAVDEAQQRFGVGLPFFVLVADEAGQRYVLVAEGVSDPGPGADGADRADGANRADGADRVVDELAAAVDELLAEANVEYRAKRSSGRLRPLVGVAAAPGTGDDYRADRVASGQRDAQFKHLHVQTLAECPFLAPLVEKAAT